MTLLPPHQADRMMLRAGAATPRGGSALASAMAHLAALGLVLSVVAKVPPPAPDPVPIPLLFSAPATTTLLSQQALARALPPVVALHAGAPMREVAAQARPHATPPTRVSPRATTHVPLARPGPAALHAVPAVAGNMGAGPAGAPPPSVATAGIDDSAVLLRFTGDVHAVIQAAAAMPRAAALQHREGRTQVRFAYLDGQIGAVAVAQSSRSRLLDDAALAAVQRAHYPAPPPALRGRRLTLLEWIDFRIAAPAPG